MPLQKSWLARAKTAQSFCTGAATAEMARAALLRTVNVSGMVDFHADIETVAVWAPGAAVLRVCLSIGAGGVAAMMFDFLRRSIHRVSN